MLSIGWNEGLAVCLGRLGPLTHLDGVGQFFASLGLSAPGLTALAVALLELAGGPCWPWALHRAWFRWSCFSSMTVAYLGFPDDRINFMHVPSGSSDFYGATPYTYWFAAFLTLVSGPGLRAVDSLLARRNSPHSTT